MTADDWRDFLEWMIWALIFGTIIATTTWHWLVQ